MQNALRASGNAKCAKSIQATQNALRASRPNRQATQIDKSLILGQESNRSLILLQEPIRYSVNAKQQSQQSCQNMWAILKRHVFAILSNPQQSWFGMFLQSPAILSNPESACFCNPLQSSAIPDRHVFAILSNPQQSWIGMFLQSSAILCNPESACICNPQQSSAILNRHVFAILAILKQSFEPHAYQTYDPGL